MANPMANASNPNAGQGGESSLNLPNWQVPVVDENGRLSRPWRQYFENILQRIGGTNGPSNDQLAQYAFAPRPAFIDDTGSEDSQMSIPGPKGDTGPQGPAGVAFAFIMDDSIDVASEAISFIGR